jgi:hypothetical protein
MAGESQNETDGNSISYVPNFNEDIPSDSCFPSGAMDGLKGNYAKKGKDVNLNVPNGQFFPFSAMDGLKGRNVKEGKGMSMGSRAGDNNNKKYRKVNGENWRVIEDSNIFGMNMGVNGNMPSIHVERPAKGRM